MPTFTVTKQRIPIRLVQHDIHQGGRLLKFSHGTVLVSEVDEVEDYVVEHSCIGNGSVGYPG